MVVQLLSCLIVWYCCPKQTRALAMDIIWRGACICITGTSNKYPFHWGTISSPNLRLLKFRNSWKAPNFPTTFGEAVVFPNFFG